MRVLGVGGDGGGRRSLVEVEPKKGQPLSPPPSSIGPVTEWETGTRSGSTLYGQGFQAFVLSRPYLIPDLTQTETPRTRIGTETPPHSLRTHLLKLLGLNRMG